ncbi:MULTISPECIES: YggT family protein [Leuconostoc]|jgi:YggT family protein|uniref:YggT family protein n=2 Tax=Leuconostoc TaxID=1243 RepID=A0A1X0VFC8_LEUPS|nr:MULTISPECIES: YggT family protein [Leuconostoc]KDA49957.1 Cell division protein YlmG/Ycf19 (putative), YggT family [Leuconostoc pseudomesenteroides PS12]CCJ67076.1 Cell division protein YlmG/Ycf19 (putative), YggT family [Leuconostoc pseudomesenteroides 4882]MBK0041137.1 YggT family protein [Leuconostoc sp. S51]MBK0052086.1 YggT family protein [Leuconostoc sp. S50]MBS0957784.1 YggT family protein [Leuconostoc pseudomesenteroides]
MIAEIVIWLFRLVQYYEYAIVIYILMSWLPGARESGLGRFLGRIVEPYLRIFRFIPPIGMLDFSPIVAILALNFARSGLLHLVSIFL